MKRKLAPIVMLSGLLLPAAYPVTAQPINPPLAGSWQLTFTPNTPPATTPPVIPIPGLATFTTDGSVIETDGAEAVPSLVTAGSIAFGSPGHGIWQPGPAIGTLFIQFFSLVVNPNGTLQAKRTVTITGQLDPTGTQFNGSYNTLVADPSGRVISTGSGTLTGQKIPHPLLP